MNTSIIETAVGQNVIIDEAKGLELLNLATVVNSFPVQLLEKVAKVELESGQYLVRKIEKGTGLASKGAIIAALSQEQCVAYLETDSIFAGYQDWLQGIVAEVCKKRIAAGATTLVPEDYSLAALDSYLQEQAINAGRVSKEKIAAWFDAAAASPLKSAFKAKLGASISDAKIAEVVASYRNGFTLLAKKEVTLEESVSTNLKKALELVVAAQGGAKSAMVTYCQAKIEGSGAKVADMLAL